MTNFPISERIAFTAGPFEFRDSGHVFHAKTKEFFGHLCYIRKAAIRAAWERWLNA